MRRSLRPLLMILAAFVALAARVEALPIAAGDNIILSDGTGSGPGGEFNVDIVGKGGTLDFITFCVERNETLSFGPQFKVTSITNTSIAGGISGGSPDPLDSRTAYLYSKFVSGGLTNYGAGGSGSATTDANQLQNLIWFYEGEITSVGTLSADAMNWKALAEANAGNGDWGVKVLNLNYITATGAIGGRAQDVLVATPEPASMVLLGSGLFGLHLLRRRARKSA